MDPATMEQLVKIARNIRGEIPISTIIMALLLAAFVGEKIWMARLKWKAYRLNGRNGGNGRGCKPTAENIADRVVEEQAIQSHYQMTEKIGDGIGRLCTGVDLQARTSVKILTVIEQVEKNTRALGRRK